MLLLVAWIPDGFWAPFESITLNPLIGILGVVEPSFMCVVDTLPGTKMEVENGPERKTMKSTTNRWHSTSMLVPVGVG